MKWSIIGCGNISNKFCDDLLNVKNAKISAIASKNPKKLKIFGDKYKIYEKNMFQEYEEILDTEFDIAYVGLINSLHKKIVKTLAIKGKNILVEKPCFLSLKEFNECEELIKKNKILFVESMMNLHHPQSNLIFDLIKSEEIGDILNFEHNFGFDMRQKQFLIFKKKIDFLNRLTDPSLGGGAINDLGCYGVAFSNKISNLLNKGSVSSLKKKNIIGPTGVDINSTVEINYSNNFKSTIKVCFNEKLGCSARILGSKGEIFIPNLVTPEKKYKVILKKSYIKEYKEDAKALYSYVASDVQRYLEKNIKEPDNHGLKLEEIKQNLKILDEWKFYENV